MVLDEFTLNGQTALVTGAASAVGQAIVAALGEAGADVAVVGRVGTDLTNASRAAERHGRRVIALSGDLTDADGVSRIVADTLKEFGKIDILVNNERLALAQPMLDISLEDWRRVQDVNLTPAFLFCKAVGSHMVERGGGKIVNVASAIGQRGVAHAAAFACSQAALAELTRTLAVEWGRHGIKVNAAAPGWIEEDGTGGEQEETLLRYLNLRRKGRAEELANMVLFLACDGCHFLTGKTIGVDGGMLAHA